MSDTRSQIGAALQGKLTEEQLRFLMDEVLAITKLKQADFSCRHCGRASRQAVEVADAKAVTSALVDLMNQSWGRPAEDKPEVEGISFVRRVVYSGAGDE